MYLYSVNHCPSMIIIYMMKGNNHLPYALPGNIQVFCSWRKVVSMSTLQSGQVGYSTPWHHLTYPPSFMPCIMHKLKTTREDIGQLVKFNKNRKEFIFMKNIHHILVIFCPFFLISS